MSVLGRHHKKIRDIGTGLLIYETFNHAYDFVFYPAVIAYLGFVDGGAIALAMSLVINSAVFLLYEYMKVDWLGAHAIREMAAEENKSNIVRLMAWISSPKRSLWEKFASPIVFITLTLPIDPVIVAIHYRREHFKGATARDWLLLWGATAAANAWWLVKVGVVIEALKLLFGRIF